MDLRRCASHAEAWRSALVPGPGSQACPKPEKRSTTKRRLDRAEAKVAAWCRAQCVERDGDCAVVRPGVSLPPFYVEELDVRTAATMRSPCDGPSEWAHMHSHRRSKTRGLDPTERHDPKHSLMLCRFHHREYDAKTLVITALSQKGANGPLRFRVKA